ncbi:zona pellucida sperm-binding protein 3-like [Cololabis saira]|uniref:zona pellucida sperm-binding protein 3-like n=1 Tax=Cololabis saira TaxID=129043 RepID=UPI002AD49E2D|nr:zona pellucida sperm-binding protein 3-like [Cololabis saira]
MAPLWFWSNLLFGFFLSALCQDSSDAPQLHHDEDVSPQMPLPRGHGSPHSVAQRQQQQERELVNTVRVNCHPDSVEIIVSADLFAVGAPVASHELQLGVEPNDLCRAVPLSEDEYHIHVAMDDCGSKHWMTEDALVYTNLLMYTPTPSPNGIIRMDEAVIPVECHYERKYSLSSSSLTPTWIPFTATQTAVETLNFNLMLMTNDWLYERGANVFYLGEPINIEASVRIGHHMGLRVFLSSCVATLTPDIHSDPKYIFIENGCLVDSQLPGSKAHFLPRTHDDKLQMVIDSFKFHNDDRGELYITCHLSAVPVTDAEATDKACTFMNRRWRSADGNDYLCGYCKSQNEVGQVFSKSSLTGPYGPRSFGDSEPMWRSAVKTNQVWDHEARVGPLTVLPARKSGPVPDEEIPLILGKIYKPALYGSHWRSGTSKFALEKGLITDNDSTSDLEEDDDDASDLIPDSGSTSLASNTTVAPSVISTTLQPDVATHLTNSTAAESDFSDKTDPKRK